MSRRSILALAVSLAIHVAGGVAIWQWTSRERIRPLPQRVAVDLSFPTPAPAATPPGPADPEPRDVPPREAETSDPPPVMGPSPRPVTAPPAWEPRPYPRRPRDDDPARSFRSPRRYAGTDADWWSRRSLVALVEDWREGGAPRDSALDRRVTHAERILASTNRGVNETFLRLRREWQEEEFRRKYAENFPPMGQIPAEPEP